MKKVFAVLAIAGFMAACNNNAEKKDSTSADTTKMENKMSDTSSMNKMADTSMNKMADTTHK